MVLFLALWVSSAGAGPYTELGVAGYLDPSGRGVHPLDDPNAVLHPIFRGWADAVADYAPAPGVWPMWMDASRALGPVSGESLEVVSLGDLDAAQLQLGLPPGCITLAFSEPNKLIRNQQGYDFVVFENGFLVADDDPNGAYLAGEMFAELAYVEVSSDGVQFARFPSVSLTAAPVGPYGCIDATNVYNLAGKHPNARDRCTGTPFDLAELSGDPLVSTGVVDLSAIGYVRLVDIPGGGSGTDQATAWPDPNTYPIYAPYARTHPIFDAWPTWGSSGFDLDALGVLQEQQYAADINLDGCVDLADLVLFSDAWLTHLGQAHYLARGDLAQPRDFQVNLLDFAVLAREWLGVETWRANWQPQGRR